MLQEIRCNRFHQQVIRFNSGLNVVLGDEKATNSIGKSTALMAIDFAFGGDDYVNNDIKEHVGDHTICFCFQFGGETFYFSRSFLASDNVNKCDSEYKPLEAWSLKQYTQWLKEQYGCNSKEATFRSIVGLYARIYGRDNLSERKPLHIASGESQENAINRLMGVFGAMDTLVLLKKEKDEAEKKATLIRQVASEKIIIVHANKRDKKEREAKLQQIEQEILGAQNQLTAGRTSVSETQLQSATALYEELEQLNTQYSKRQSQLRRLNRSANDLKVATEVNIEELRVFFPSINMQEIEDVNSFHEQLTTILSSEVKKQMREAENAMQRLQECIDDVNQKIREALGANEEDATSMAIKRLMDRVAERERLRMEDQYAQDMEQFNDAKKQTNEAYENAKVELLHDIELQLNKSMEVYNRQTSKRKTNPPQLKLSPKTYTFTCEHDTGAGTKYIGLLLFDLSVLQLTTLPYLIHDTVLFKNIGTETVGELISIYERFTNKQIFICLDQIGIYGREIYNKLQQKAVLHIGPDKETLFGRPWNIVGE